VTDFLKDIAPVKFAGPDSTDPMAFHHYDANETLMGKPLRDHLRFAAAYWHSFAWEGGDPFGGQTFQRPWYPQDNMANAKKKADTAFEMFRILGVPYFCFHDADIHPDGGSFPENEADSRKSPTTLVPRWKRWAPSFSGARRTCSATAATCRAHPPTRPRCLRVRRGNGQKLHGCDPQAGRRKLCALGWSRRLRVADQHRHGAGNWTTWAGF